MACYHPSRVSISRKVPDAVGGHRISDTVTVPCGHCLGCRSDQARGWAVRLVHEGVVAFPAWFVTLTYAPEKVPAYGSLAFRDVTLFVKRLRRMYEGGPHISYYLAGEYGDHTARPHYHAVLYGPKFLDRSLYTYRHDAPVYKSGELEMAWKLGLCEFTPLTYAAARYCASYVRKKVRKGDDEDAYARVVPGTGELVELERESARMSRRPAIGKRWIERYWKDVYPRDAVVIDGMELKPPRYYDRWLEKHHPKVMLDVRQARYDESRDISVATLEAKEKAHKYKVHLNEGRAAI